MQHFALLCNRKWGGRDKVGCFEGNKAYESHFTVAFEEFLQQQKKRNIIFASMRVFGIMPFSLQWKRRVVEKACDGKGVWWKRRVVENACDRKGVWWKRRVVERCAVENSCGGKGVW